MRVTGRIISVDEYGGKFADKETGEMVSYSGQRVGVFDGREVVKVKVKASKIAALGGVVKGDDVDLIVDCVAEGGARGVYLTVTFVELAAA